MQRRDFIILLGSIAATRVSPCADQPMRMWRNDNDHETAIRTDSYSLVSAAGDTRFQLYRWGDYGLRHEWRGQYAKRAGRPHGTNKPNCW